MPSKSRPAFTLIELLVVIGIMGFLAAILLAAFSRVRGNARRSVCQSNLRQLGLAMRQYNSDYDDMLMPSFVGPNTTFNRVGNVSWPVLLQPYVKNEQVFICPSAAPEMDWKLDTSPTLHDACWGSTGIINNAKALARVCYGVNISVHGTSVSPNGFVNEAAVLEPTITASALDSIWIDGSSTNLLRFGRAGFPRHFDGVNVLYEDGHVKWITPAGLQTLRFNP